MSLNSLNQQGRHVVCLKNVPAVMNGQDIENICKKFGEIDHINTKKRPLIFVNAANESSYESILRGLKGNEYGIIAEPATFMRNNYRSSYRQNRAPSTASTGAIPKNVAHAQQNPHNAARTKDEDCKGICQVCQKPANLRCQRCGDFYCSKECQTTDYPQHRFICLAMPPLVEQNSRDIGLPIYQFQGAQHSVGEHHNKPLRKAASHNVLNKVKKNYRSQILPISQNPNLQKGGSNQTKTNNQTQPTSDKPKPVPQSIKNDMQPVRSEKVNGNEKKDNKYGPNVTQKQTDSNKLNNTVTNKSSLDSLIVKTNKVVEKEKSTDTFPANGSIVCIQAALKSNRIWIRSLDKHLNESFVELQQTISKCAPVCDGLKVLPKTGDFVLADFKKGVFCRALVIHVYHEQEIVLRFVDSGNVGSRRLDQLKTFSSGLPKTQIYTHLVHLKNVPEFDLAPEQQSLIQKYADSLTEFKISYDNAKSLEVFLDNYSTNERLNTKLSEFASKRNSCTISEPKPSSATPQTSSSDSKSTPQVVLNETAKEKPANNATTEVKNGSVADEKEVTVQDIKNMAPASLDEEENVAVYVVDNSMLDLKMFCSVDIRFLSVVKKNEQEFGAFAKADSKPYKPRDCEVCLAYSSSEDKWFRAECILESDNTPSLTFIDYGVTRDVPITNIRKYPRTLLRPCFMKTCSIENSTPLKPEIVAELKRLIPQNEKIILNKRKKTYDGNYSVYIKDVDEKLKAF